ncbi:MAG TPA: peptidase M10 [Ferruginibacter sp.]|nr:peptidase M10 [Ferruginibacter sp.]HMP20821.1 peptidase M10 [Ferruginibacter sp.]
MGEVEVDHIYKRITIHSVLFFYGAEANHLLSNSIAADIARQWNEPGATLKMGHSTYRVYFDITGIFRPGLTAQDVITNNNPRHNYFRIEAYSPIDISFTDGIAGNTGFFKLDNLLYDSTTAAHEYGHTLGLHHPANLDIRGQGTPGIMYPRGTLADAPYQYNPAAKAGEPGSTLDPSKRKVLQQDIDNLQLHRLHFNATGHAVIGKFSAVWHPVYHF